MSERARQQVKMVSVKGKVPPWQESRGGQGVWGAKEQEKIGFLK